MTRYLIGSIVGAACLFTIIQSGSCFGIKINKFLHFSLGDNNSCLICTNTNATAPCWLSEKVCFRDYSNTKPNGVSNQKSECKIDSNESQSASSRLILLLALGFGYCYLVSAPLTLLHYSRSLLDACQNTNRKSFWLMYYGINAALLLLPLLSLIAAYTTGLIIIYILLFIVFLSPLIFYGRKHGFNFYSKKASIFSCNDIYHKEYKTSYRDLAEHGNAYMIVIYEILWAVILSCKQINMTSAIFLILGWILLGAICLMIARALELELVYPNARWKP